MKKYSALLFVLLGCSTKAPQPAPILKYCVSHTITPYYLDAFSRQHDTFVQEVVQEKMDQSWQNISNHSSTNEDLKILRDKDAVPLLVKKYELLTDPNPDSKITEPFIFFGEMPRAKFQQFKKDISENFKEMKYVPKYCFTSALPLKHDSYDGVAVFFAQDYEIVK